MYSRGTIFFGVQNVQMGYNTPKWGTLGSPSLCSHRAAVMWFLAYQRHCNETSAKQSSSSYLEVFDDSELVDDFVESSDEDDNFLYTLP